MTRFEEDRGEWPKPADPEFWSEKCYIQIIGDRKGGCRVMVSEDYGRTWSQNS